MEDLDHELKMEIFVESEKINDDTFEGTPEKRTRPKRKATKRPAPKDSTDDENDNNIDIIDNSNILYKVSQLEKELKICKKELSEIKDENLALRENNIKYQVEIFKLRRQHASDVTVNGETPRLSFLQRYQEIVKTQNQQIAKTDQLIYKKKRIAEIKNECQVKIELAEKRKQFNTSENPVDDEGIPIKLTDSDVEELAEIEIGIKGDSKFVNKMLVTLFDYNTLLNSTISGKSNTSKKQTKRSTKPLDTNKMLFMRQLFSKRLKKEGAKKNERKEREKLLNAHVNHKICNLRKCEVIRKTKLLKMEEAATLEDPFYA